MNRNELLSYIFTTLNEANFEAISTEMYRQSIENVYLSDLPIIVDWPKLDSNLMTQFFTAFPDLDPYRNLETSKKPPFHMHFAIFYRGYGLHFKNGLFFSSKLNLIINDINKYFIQWFTGSLFLAEKNVNNSIIGERISLVDTFKYAKINGWQSILWWFLKNVHLQEPTFNRLVLVYRSLSESLFAQQFRRVKESSQRMGVKLGTKVQKHLKRMENQLKKDIHQKLNKNVTKLLSDVISDDIKEEKDDIQIVDELGRRRSARLLMEPSLQSIQTSKAYSEPIRIQYFSDIPMADLELSYPCKRMSLKPMDKIYLFITLFLGTYAIFRELFFSNSSWIGTITLLTCVLLMIRALIWYRNTEQTYIQTVNQTLFNSTISTDKDVLLSLLDNVNEQEFMETVLAYFVLHMYAENEDMRITDSESVDRLCEQLLREEFGSEVDVEINDAMRKLSDLGLFALDEKYSRLDNIRVKCLSDSVSCVHQHFLASEQTFRSLHDVQYGSGLDDIQEDGEVEKSSGSDEEKSRVMSGSDKPLVIVSDHFRKKSDVSEDDGEFETFKS